MAVEQLKRDQLITDYQDYAGGIARKLMARMCLPKSLEEDMVSAGYVGLIEAADRFDPACGREFRHFAFLRVRGAIIDSLRKSSDLSSTAYRYARALRAAQDLREQDFVGSEASGDGSVPLARVLEYAARGALAYRLSASNESIDDIQLDTNDPELLMTKREDALALKKYVAGLPEKERIIIEQYYFQGKSFVEIARDNSGLSKSWVSRLHSRALGRLREICCDSSSEDV